MQRNVKKKNVCNTLHTYKNVLKQSLKHYKKNKMSYMDFYVGTKLECENCEMQDAGRHTYLFKVNGKLYCSACLRVPEMYKCVQCSTEVPHCNVLRIIDDKTFICSLCFDELERLPMYGVCGSCLTYSPVWTLAECNRCLTKMCGGCLITSRSECGVCDNE